MTRRLSITNLGPDALRQARAKYSAAVQIADVDPVQYAERARAHMPTDPEAIAAEVRRLAASGLTAHDVASAMRLPVASVLEALARRAP